MGTVAAAARGDAVAVSVTIRPLATADREAWLPIWQGYLDFSETAVPEAVTDETWRRLIDPTGRIHGFGAFDAGGRLVGIVHYLFIPSPGRLPTAAIWKTCSSARKRAGQGRGGR